jgi:hypothetical protein
LQPLPGLKLRCLLAAECRYAQLRTALYQIEPQQQFSIIAESEKALPRIEIDQLAGSQMIVTLVGSDEFYVLQNGKRLHHLRDLRTNVEGM